MKGLQFTGMAGNSGKILWLVILILLISLSCFVLSGCATSTISDSTISERTTHRKNAEEVRQEWKLVSSFAKIRMVYMSPAGLKDKDYIAQVLTQLVDKKDIIQVLFFDNKKYTPLDYPMTDKQMLHWKANYNFNPNTGHERFVFIEIINPNASPPDLKEIEAKIKPARGPTINSTKELATSSEYLIKALQETGLIGRINIESNEVWVDESLWYSTNVGEKENIIRLISQYFDEKRGYERVTVYGWHTGKMLATMTLFGGIKFY